jgi:3-hydroxyacyl-[acyl-carrier-protein] dehydratase
LAKKGIINPKDYPLDEIFMGPEEFGRFNPQRHEFLQLTNILHYNEEANLLVAHRHVEKDEWWSRGHIPERPILPGALMVEMLAQAGSAHANLIFKFPENTFVGFAGLDSVRFRGSVSPPCDLMIAGQVSGGSAARKAFRWKGQVLTMDGSIICEGEVFGMGL